MSAASDRGSRRDPSRSPRRHRWLAAPGRLRRHGRSDLELLTDLRVLRRPGLPASADPERARRTRRRRVLDGGGGVRFGGFPERPGQGRNRDRATRTRTQRGGRASRARRPVRVARGRPGARARGGAGSCPAIPRRRSRSIPAKNSGCPRTTCRRPTSRPVRRSRRSRSGPALPLLPFLFGASALWPAAVVAGLALLFTGAVVARITARPLWYGGLRQLILGAVAAAVTFGVGAAIGTHVG